MTGSLRGCVNASEPAAQPILLSHPSALSNQPTNGRSTKCSREEKFEEGNRIYVRGEGNEDLRTSGMLLSKTCTEEPIL
ncbi:hypothetical protein L596_026636 [Steinernema carpocapsae]|uniref:Uncharacterized protein n=1 Tax=Steinernema carpocapsae TaxID=34508 RepID=A0A4V5ZY89_STECR|nr:hypothetical protein L596_026636 [Steinernema carpocapsae]